MYILYCRFDLGLKTLSVLGEEPRGLMIWVSSRKSLKEEVQLLITLGLVELPVQELARPKQLVTELNTSC